MSIVYTKRTKLKVHLLTEMSKCTFSYVLDALTSKPPLIVQYNHTPFFEVLTGQVHCLMRDHWGLEKDFFKSFFLL